MPNQGMQTTDQEKKVYLFFDAKLKEVMKKKESLLNGRSLSELPFNQKITVSQLNKEISELSWRCFEETCKEELYQIAVRYFVKAFELGWDKAIELYEKTRLTIQHQKNSEKSSTNKTPVCLSPRQYALKGLRYTLGLGLPVDYEKAVHCFSKAGHRGDILGLCGLAMALERERNYKEAELKYKQIKNKLSDWDHSKSLPITFTDLCTRYLGKFTATQGNARAQYVLGFNYNLQKKKKKQAFYWLRLAAEQGCSDAQYALVEHYGPVDIRIDNYGTCDIKSILYWYRQSYKTESTNHYLNPLRKFGLLGEYTIAILQCNYPKIASLLLCHKNLQQEFLNNELDDALSTESGFILLGGIISSLQSEVSQNTLTDNNDFLIRLLTSLNKKAPPTGRNVLVIIPPLREAINYAETDPNQIEQLMVTIVQIWNWDRNDCTALYNLRCLWYRALSIGYKIESGNLLKEIASMLISTLCKEAYVINNLAIEPFHLNLLFAYTKAGKILSPENINLILGSNLLISQTAPEKSAEQPPQINNNESMNKMPNKNQFFKASILDLQKEQLLTCLHVDLLLQN